MNRKEYVIESCSLDKKSLRNYLTYSDENYEYPCMITIKSVNGCKQYYVERSNIRDQGFLIIDWGSRIKE